MDMFTCVSSVFCATWVAMFSRKAGAGAAPLPPGPRGFSILGYLRFLGTDLHLTFTHLASVYGPIYRVRFANKMCLILNSPAVTPNEAWNILASLFSKKNTDRLQLLEREMLIKASLDAHYNIKREDVQKAIREVYTNTGTHVKIGKTVLNTTSRPSTPWWA
uniref:LAGLIDADG homing endonuclease n=1 Tax=Kalanchoe fedtschenkoi TaxID=63787 RepID=A0A7N0U558_KALFE